MTATRKSPSRRDRPSARSPGPSRVAIYLRRSTDDEHQPFSIDAQQTALDRLRHVPARLDPRRHLQRRRVRRVRAAAQPAAGTQGGAGRTV